jgi:DNA transposition AAA+ family ATPase
MNYTAVNRPAPLKNIAAFSTLITKVVERRPDLPGMACFFGFSGLGKSKAAVYGANKYRAAYVECGQFTTAKSLLKAILVELGAEKPRGAVTDMIEQAVLIMASDPRRPVIVDEAHHIAAKRFVDVLRELHDKSTAPVILIGEETLPKQLEAFERVHNRMLAWVPAVAIDVEDFAILAKVACQNITIAPDLRDEILSATHGNTRRIIVNFAEVEQKAKALGVNAMDLEAFGGRSAIVGLRAPSRSTY